MDSAQIAVTVAGCGLIGFTLWFFFGAVDRNDSRKPSNEAANACPMHPWITSTDPGAVCSVCGMKLQRNDEVIT